MKSTMIQTIIWFAVAGIWSVNLGMSIFINHASLVVIILQAVCVLSSLTAAIANFGKYKNEKKK